MAIGWITLLQAVPWSEVIRNAPKVADGARKLWNMASRSTPAPQAAKPGTQQPTASEPQAIAALEARVRTLEATVGELHEQMLASSELIKALAEQNTELIRRVETNRVRMLWLAAAMGLAIIAIIWLAAA